MVDESIVNIPQFLPGRVLVRLYPWSDVTQWWHPKRMRVRRRHKAPEDESVIDDAIDDEEGAGESTDEDVPPVEDLHD